MPTVLVTGATSGIGLAIAQSFARQNYQVIATGRRKERLQELQKEFGNLLLPLELDVKDRKGMETTLKNLPKEFSQIDILVNNAGLALGLNPAPSADLDDWEDMVDTNIKGLMALTRFILPGMVERNKGHIINIGSIAGELPYPGGNVYGGTKAFVKQFSLNLKADLLGTNIRVTNIEPGMVGGSEFSQVRFKGDEARANAVYEGLQPLMPDDIADSVLWAATRPAHVNIQEMLLMPVCQAFSPFAFKKGT